MKDVARVAKFLVGFLVALTASSGLDAAWIETAQLFDAGGSVDERLGESVAIDGDVAVVASPGRVFVFVRSSGIWTQAATLSPSTSRPGDEFGVTVAVSSGVVAVGVLNSFDNSGAVDVFLRPPGGWTGAISESARLATGADFDFLGSSVTFAGQDIASGALLAGKVYVFQRPTSGWSGTVAPSCVLTASDGVSGDEFGFSIGGSSDLIVAGAPAGLIGTEGKAYVFAKPATGWKGSITESAELLPSDNVPNSQFGSAAVTDGTNIIVTSHGKGYVFVRPQTGWSGLLNENAQLVGSNVVPSLTDFGASASLSGKTVVIGDPGGEYGAAYIFERPATGWAGTIFETQEIDGSAQDEFFYATSVAISGNTIVVSADFATVNGNTQQGEAHVYDFAQPYITRTRFLVQGPIRVAPGVPVEFSFRIDTLRDSPIAPTGEVVVSDGAGHTCRSDVNVAGEGSCMLTFGTPGNYRVRADYLGNLSFAGSTSPVTPVLVGKGGAAP